MPKNDSNNKTKDSTLTGNMGYQPLNGGYQPVGEKRGYSPTASSGNGSGSCPNPPKGGTGQSSGKS